jgi:sensor histidine kinase regulating citrate/malate metabolism
VKGHVARVKRILSSICDLFSLEASENEPVNLRVELVEAGKKVTLCIARVGVMPVDTSVGKQAFLVFRKLYSSSMGISLYVVERCMDRLGGKIWVESAPATGLKVFLQFDVA